MSESEDDEYPFEWKSGDLMTWIKQQVGARVSSKIELVDFRSRGAGRGVVANTDIKLDEELFSIPLSAVLSVNTSSLLTTHLGPTLQELDDWLALALALLFEMGQGDRSKWSAYLKVLPASFDTLMHWTQAELDELTGCAVLDKIGKVDAEKAFTEQLVPLVKQNAYMFPQFTASEELNDIDATILRSAHVVATLIMAYAFDLEEEPDNSASDDDQSEVFKSQKAMVPLADMLNADGDRNNAHLVQTADSLDMVALKCIRQGDEIFNDYGQLPRSDLLRRYGYVTDRYKTWDVVEIAVDLVIRVVSDRYRLDEESKKQRLGLAQQQWGINADSFELTRNQTSTGFEFDSALYLLVDALTMDPVTLQEEIDANETPGEPRFTREMGVALREVLLAHLKSYKTTIAKDTARLQDDYLSRRLRMAVEVRLGEKELVAVALDGLQHQMEDMSGGVQSTDESREREDEKSQAEQSKKRKI